MSEKMSITRKSFPSSFLIFLRERKREKKKTFLQSKYKSRNRVTKKNTNVEKKVLRIFFVTAEWERKSDVCERERKRKYEKEGREN